MRLIDQSVIDEALAKSWGRWAKVLRGRVVHWFSAHEKGVALCGAAPPLDYADLRHCPKCETELRSAQYVAGIRMPANRNVDPHTPWNDKENDDG